MAKLGLETEIVDRQAYDHSVSRFRDAGIVLPTFAQLADPDKIPPRILERLETVEPDQPHPLNLFRVHWNNAANRRQKADIPQYLELPRTLTGVAARIVCFSATHSR